jgi:Flp pilus assembly protein TadG
MDALLTLVRRLRHSSGAELIEFALVLPMLLLVIVGIFDFGFLFRDFGVITNAAREGARIGVLTGYTTADVQSRAGTYLTAAGLDAAQANTTVAVEDLAVGGTASVKVVRVTVTYPHSFSFLGPIAGLVGGSFGSVSLRAVSTMRVEAPSS